MIKDKQGNEYTWKEFIQKWKKGIEGITPLQQVKSQINGTRLMLFGLFCGLFVLSFKIKTTWWIEIILAAGLFNTYISLIGLKQKRNVLNKFNSSGLTQSDILSVLNQEEVKQ